MSRRYFLSPSQREDIIKRFYKKVRDKYKTDAAFYEAYDVASGTFQHWKRDKNINWALIIEFCATEYVSLDYVLRDIQPEDLPQKKKIP